jgi:tetratricopeptide (TPR) repeat protein
MGRIDFFPGFVLVCLLFHATPGLAYSTNNTESALSGTVFAEGTNQRLANAAVALYDEAGTPVQQATTDESGGFSFQGLRAARYALKVLATDFQMAEVHVDLTFTSSRGLSIVLKPNPLPASATSVEQTISAHELSMPQDARDLVASGRKKLYIEKNATAALSDFQSATAKAPTYYAAYLQEGMAYLSQQNFDKAEKLFRQSVEMSDKKCAEADIALASLLLQRNQVSEGESLLRLGLTSHPRSWPGQFELGKLEFSRDHLQAALSAAENAKTLAPRQATVYRLLAAIHLRQQNYSALIADIDSYLELDSDSAAATRAKELRAEAQRKIANAPATAVAVK